MLASCVRKPLHKMTSQLEGVLNLYERKFLLCFRKYDNCVCSSFAVPHLELVKHRRRIFVSFQKTAEI